MNYCIENLIRNLPQRETPLKLDIILEGGAFNGGYQYGVMTFIDELKKKNYVETCRISGCSVGAIVGALFIFNKLHLFDFSYEKLRQNLKKNLNLKNLKRIIEDIFNDITVNDFKKFKNDTLFISYYDVINKKHIVQSRFRDKEDLIAALLKSAHLPYIVNGDGLFDGKYVDGFFPYIFPERERNNENKILYLTINRFSQLYKIFNIQNELSSSGRALEGIMDVYKFLLYQKETKICSFINEWSLLDYTKIRIKHLCIAIFIYIYYFGLKLYPYIAPFFTKIELFQYIQPVIKEYCRDLILFLCF